MAARLPYADALGVDSTASVSEIKKAFRRRALAVHPDKGGSDAAFHEIVVAFEQALAAGAGHDEKDILGSAASPTRRRAKGSLRGSRQMHASDFQSHSRSASALFKDLGEEARWQPGLERPATRGVYSSMPSLETWDFARGSHSMDFFTVRTGSKLDGSLKTNSPVPPLRCGLRPSTTPQLPHHFAYGNRWVDKKVSMQT
eukprot:TRINITY_DN23979_c0_g1_i1.p2 TRINITY_DN23979_c0_g1~~TRINITY_DN23979_c0_g1_i1.p2  ORF type:complete len:200 (-),score=38.58 TRINITY_DN23979_c0_g1_i1:619-1218(-)